MSTKRPENPSVLYLICCAAPPTQVAGVMVELSKKSGWDVCVVLTPQAVPFAHVPMLEALTGHPVRSEYKRPNDPDVLPPPDAIVVAPATFNTINKCALGIADTLALGLLTEGIGKRLPIVFLPCLNTAQARHPALETSIERLRSCGVKVLAGAPGFEPLEPESGVDWLPDYPWHLGLAALQPPPATGS